MFIVGFLVLPSYISFNLLLKLRLSDISRMNVQVGEGKLSVFYKLGNDEEGNQLSFLQLFQAD